MMLTIAIIAALGYIISFIRFCIKDKIDVDICYAVILILSTWHVLPLAIVIIVISVIIMIIGSIKNYK